MKEIIKMVKIKKNKKGITLIALVITIIVLLILAGITIAQLSGSGLFDNVKLAKEKYKNSEKDEDETISDYGNEINNYINGYRDNVIYSYADYNYFSSEVTQNTQGSTSATAVANYDGIAKIYHYQATENTVSCSITRGENTANIYFDYFTKSRSYFIPVKQGDSITATTTGNSAAGSVVIVIYPKEID